MIILRLKTYSFIAAIVSVTMSFQSTECLAGATVLSQRINAKTIASFQLLKSDAEKGDINSKLLLALGYIIGYGTKQDIAAAVKITDNSFDLFGIEIIRIIDGYISIELYGYALELMKRSIETKYTNWNSEQRNQFENSIRKTLGECLTFGTHGDKALYLLEKMASLNSADAAFQLGLYYYGDESSNNKISDNLKKSIVWFTEASRLGSVSAFKYLGTIYDNGYGTLKDHQVALRYFKLAAEKGDVRSLASIGIMYEFGRGTENDLPNLLEAEHYYRLGTDKDDPFAMYHLGLMYEKGKGVQKDVAQALSLYQLAVAKGYSKAQIGIKRLVSLDREEIRERVKPNSVNRSIIMPNDLKNSADPVESTQAGGGAYGAISKRLDEQLAMAQRMAKRNNYEAASRIYRDIGNDYESLGDYQESLNARIKDVLYWRMDYVAVMGEAGSYSQLLHESCQWGQLSRWAFEHEQKGPALYFAKRSVNLLQEARKFLSGLAEEHRECFLKAHENRYRWLTDLLIEQGRLSEAETVLRMLKDFEFTEYVRGDHKSSKSNQQRFPMSKREIDVDNLMDAIDLKLVASSARRDELLALEREKSLTPSQTAELARIEKQFVEARAKFDDQVSSISKTIGNFNNNRELHRSAPSEESLASLQMMLNDRRASYKSSEAVVQTVILPERLHLLLTTADMQKVFTVNVKQKDLNNIINKFRFAIRNGKEDTNSLGEQIYNLTFGRIDAYLKEAKIKTVVISPDQGLSFVPFSALFDGKGYLVERYAFATLTDPSYANSPTGADRKWRIATFGVTEASENTTELPAVQVELEGISHLSGEKAIPPALDAMFTREKLSLAISSFEVVHIATHFIASGNESTSYLLLGKSEKTGINDHLTVEELRKLRFNRTQLLTLSACETAVPLESRDGSRMDAVARSAQVIGGARSVVATLWRVPDASTAAFMRRFYELLLREPKLSKGEALARVQREFINRQVEVANNDNTKVGGLEKDSGTVIRAAPDSRNDGVSGAGSWSRPLHWAPFLILGNWS